MRVVLRRGHARLILTVLANLGLMGRKGLDFSVAANSMYLGGI